MKKFFLFSQRGMTDRFFCGNIYEAFPGDEIRYCGDKMPFEILESMGLCKSFETRKAANEFSRDEEEAMEDSNEYARQAMYNAEKYGCEGVDC